MGELRRVDRMSGPLVVGKFYLVPTVRAHWGAIICARPVANA